MDKEYYELIFEKHFGDQECRKTWENWSPNIVANIGTSIVMLEQLGPIPDDVIAKLRQAIIAKDLTSLYEITATAQKNSIANRHASSYGSIIRSSYPASATIEFSVDIDGENYLVIYGNHINGGFCCIPNRGFGCEMSDADDAFFNAKKLFAKFDLRTSYAIAENIKKMCGSTDSNAPAKNNEEEPCTVNDIAILEQPWPTVMQLSTRAHNCLARNGRPTRGGKELHTVGDVAAMTMDEIYGMRNAGVVTRKEIANALRNLGVKYSSWYNV